MKQLQRNWDALELSEEVIPFPHEMGTAKGGQLSPYIGIGIHTKLNESNRNFEIHPINPSTSSTLPESAGDEWMID